MKVVYINPFIKAVNAVFKKMLNCEVERGEVGLSLGDIDIRHFTALIGLSGAIQGNVALSFPVASALNITSRILGIETKVVDETVTDSLGEMVNMVAGAAKAQLAAEKDSPTDLTLPLVIRGSDYNLMHPSQAMWLEVNFTSELGPFFLRVTLEDDSSEAPAKKSTEEIEEDDSVEAKHEQPATNGEKASMAAEVEKRGEEAPDENEEEEPSGEKADDSPAEANSQ